MAHIFVHHAEDPQGHALAALVKHCDTQTHRRFQFLVIDGASSIQRMNNFLREHGLSRTVVRLPFIILIQRDSENTVVRRSVLHGPPLQQWLGEMVDALLDTPGMSPMRVKQMFLDPFISPHLIRLIQHTSAAIEPMMTLPMQPPPEKPKRPKVEVVAPPPPPPPAFIEEVEEPEENTDDDPMHTDGVTLSMATMPVPKQGLRDAPLAKKGRKDDHLQNAKERDAMIQRKKSW